MPARPTRRCIVDEQAEVDAVDPARRAGARAPSAGRRTFTGERLHHAVELRGTAGHERAGDELGDPAAASWRSFNGRS